MRPGVELGRGFPCCDANGLRPGASRFALNALGLVDFEQPLLVQFAALGSHSPSSAEGVCK